MRCEKMLLLSFMCAFCLTGFLSKDGHVATREDDVSVVDEYSDLRICKEIEEVDIPLLFNLPSNKCLEISVCDSVDIDQMSSSLKNKVKIGNYIALSDGIVLHEKMSNQLVYYDHDLNISKIKFLGDKEISKSGGLYLLDHNQNESLFNNKDGLIFIQSKDNIFLTDKHKGAVMLFAKDKIIRMNFPYPQSNQDSFISIMDKSFIKKSAVTMDKVRIDMIYERAFTGMFYKSLSYNEDIICGSFFFPFFIKTDLQTGKVEMVLLDHGPLLKEFVEFYHKKIPEPFGIPTRFSASYSGRKLYVNIDHKQYAFILALDKDYKADRLYYMKKGKDSTLMRYPEIIKNSNEVKFLVKAQTTIPFAAGTRMVETISILKPKGE